MLRGTQMRVYGPNRIRPQHAILCTSPPPLGPRPSHSRASAKARPPLLPHSVGVAGAPGPWQGPSNSQPAQPSPFPSSPSSSANGPVPPSSASKDQQQQQQQQQQSEGANNGAGNGGPEDTSLTQGNFHLRPIHIILFLLIFVGGAAFATITLQFTAGMEFRLAVSTVLRRVAKSAAFRQLVVIGFTVFLLRFGLNNLMQTLAKFSLSPVQWDKTKLYYLLREVYQPLELLLFVAALCTISDAFLPSLIAIPKATVSHVVKSILSTSFILGFANVVFNLKSRFCKESAWQAEMKGDATSQRRWEAYDKLGTFVIFVMSIVLGIQAMGLEVGSVLAIGGIGGLAIGLAGREICENLLSGFLIMSTNPFEVGDEVTFFHNNKVIEGIVADIGWYRTLIRSFEREMFVIPNAVFSKNIVLNVTRKGREWRLLETIYLRVQDVQKANAIAQDIRRIMRSDTRVMNKLHRRVFVDKITKDDVQIYMSFYLDAANRDAFMAIKQDLMVSFVDCVERNGAKLATPRTVLDLDPEMLEALDSLNVHGYAAYAMARDLVAQKQQQAQMQPAQLPSPPVITAEITAVDRSPPSGPSNSSSSSSSQQQQQQGGSRGGGGEAGSSWGTPAGSGGGAATKEKVGAGAVTASASSQGTSSNPSPSYTSATNHFIPSHSSQQQQQQQQAANNGATFGGYNQGYGGNSNSSHHNGVHHRVGDVYSTHTMTGMLQVPSAPSEPVTCVAATTGSQAQNNVVSANNVASSPFSSASRAANGLNNNSSSSSSGSSGGGVGRSGGAAGDVSKLELSEEELAEQRRVHVVGHGVVSWGGGPGSRDGGGGGDRRGGGGGGKTASASSSAPTITVSPSGVQSPSQSPKSQSQSPSPRSSPAYSGPSMSSGSGSGSSSSSSAPTPSSSPARGAGAASNAVSSQASQAAKVKSYQQDQQARQARHQSPDRDFSRDFSSNTPPGPTGLPLRWLRRLATLVFNET